MDFIRINKYELRYKKKNPWLMNYQGFNLLRSISSEILLLSFLLNSQYNKGYPK